MTSFPLWAERLYNRPLALDQFKNEVLCEFAQNRITGVRPEKITAATLDIQTHAMAADAVTIRDGVRLPYATSGDIAIVPVRGTLVHKGSWADAESGLVGYDRILSQARAAVSDPQVSAIWMPFDSGGGECAGMFAAAEELATMAKSEGGKPIYAWLDERACSAAYVLASAADKIFGRPEVMGASIAAIINVVDKSKAYEKMGLEPIVIRAEWADRKGRGQAGEKIDKDTIAKLGAIVDETSQQIIEFVAAMRGTTTKALRDLRGDVFTGPDLVKFGLLDDTLSEREAWDALKAEARA
jgi:ClpP class serine protease